MASSMTITKEYGVQHDDHIWLTVEGEAWAIESMNWPVIMLWRGYEPDLEFRCIELDGFPVEAYCDAAVATLKAKRDVLT